jgi:hypothetical protein
VKNHSTLIFWLALAGWLLAGPLPVGSAAPLTQFEQFLAGGPARWSTTHPMAIPQGVKLTNLEGTLKDNLAVQYAMWQRDRHPASFDRRHPMLGPLLAEMQNTHGTQFLWIAPRPGTSAPAQAIHADSASSSSPQAEMLMPSLSNLPGPGGFHPPLAQEISSYSVVTSQGLTRPQSLLGSPAPVPEPSSWAVALLFWVSASGWMRRRHVRRGQQDCQVSGKLGNASPWAS